MLTCFYNAYYVPGRQISKRAAHVNSKSWNNSLLEFLLLSPLDG